MSATLPGTVLDMTAGVGGVRGTGVWWVAWRYGRRVASWSGRRVARSGVLGGSTGGAYGGLRGGAIGLPLPPLLLVGEYTGDTSGD